MKHVIMGGATALAWPFAGFFLGRKKAERFFNDECLSWALPEDAGTTDSLSILPLIDWYTADGELCSEPGVSYLVRTDANTILFDVGFNMHGEHPSPLLMNMERLGVDMDDIDTIVISHPHLDHVGGVRNELRGTFSLSARPLDISGRNVFLPPGVTRPDVNYMTVNRPVTVGKGIVSTGPVYRSLFMQGLNRMPVGFTPEQALVVNVTDVGPIIICGCGHQRLDRLLELTASLFGRPAAGIVGGLHFPVTSSRIQKLGGRLQGQKMVGTGKLPWNPITKDEVAENIALLRQIDPALVSLSAHDSCDWSIEAFKQAFGPRYTDLVVGREIRVA